MAHISDRKITFEATGDFFNRALNVLMNPYTKSSRAV
jgi:hypothetical protein